MKYLKTISLPKTVTKIDTDALRNGDSLTTIYYYGTTQPSYSQPFHTYYSLKTIYVPTTIPLTKTLIL